MLIHDKKFLETFSDWASVGQKFNDINVICSDKETVPCNLSSLAAASPFIRNIFSDLTDFFSNDVSIQLPDFPSCIVRSVVNYLYGEKVIVSEIDKKPFLDCVNIFQCFGDKVSTKICDFCKKSVFPSSMIQHFQEHQSKLKLNSARSMRSRTRTEEPICPVCAQMLVGATIGEEKLWWREHLKICNDSINRATDHIVDLGSRVPLVTVDPEFNDPEAFTCPNCHRGLRTSFELTKHSEKCRIVNSEIPVTDKQPLNKSAFESSATRDESCTLPVNQTKGRDSLIVNITPDDSPSDTDVSNLQSENDDSGRKVGHEISCRKCDKTFSTKETMILHTCHSILDKTIMVSDGETRKTRPNVRFDEVLEESQNSRHQKQTKGRKKSRQVMSKSPIVDLSSESEDELFEEDDIDLHRTISPSHEEVNREMASELLTEESRVCSGPNASIYSTASNSAQRTRPLPKSVALRRQKLASSNSLTNPEGEMSMSGQETRLLAESSKVAKPKLGPLSIKRTSDSSESDKPENFSEVSAPESSLDHPIPAPTSPPFDASKYLVATPMDNVAKESSTDEKSKKRKPEEMRNKSAKKTYGYYSDEYRNDKVCDECGEKFEDNITLREHLVEHYRHLHPTF